MMTYFQTKQGPKTTIHFLADRSTISAFPEKVAFHQQLVYYHNFDFNLGAMAGLGIAMLLLAFVGGVALLVFVLKWYP